MGYTNFNLVPRISKYKVVVVIKNIPAKYLIAYTIVSNQCLLF